MILVIDNNDSFTYNLIDYIKTQTMYQVVGIDNLLIEDGHINMKPKAIVISPGWNLVTTEFLMKC